MIKIQYSNPTENFKETLFYHITSKRISMLSQVKRKQKLLLALTLTVLFTSSILVFSIQAAYSAADYNSSRSNTQTAITQLQTDLMDLKSNFGVYLDGNNVESFIDIMIMELDVVQTGLVEMDEFYFSLNTELESLKQGLNSDSNEVAVESMKQTTESATEKGAYSNITLERSDFANGFVVLDDLQNVAPILHQSVCSGKVEESCETLFNDSWVIVVSKSMLGDTTSDKLEEYLKVTLSNVQGTSIRVGEDWDADDTPSREEKVTVSPGLQPEDFKPKVPNWVKSNAGWYAEGLITEEDFVVGLEWMINNGVIQIDSIGDSKMIDGKHRADQY